MTKITVRLLGPVEMRDAEGHESHRLPSQPKRFGLLSYLATAQPRGFHSRDKLLGLFWPEASHELARHALNQALHVLRSELGDGAIRSRGDSDVAIDEASIWCDVVEFEQAVDAGKYEQALKLYRGDLLEGLFVREASEFERWLEEERTRLREKAAGAAWALAHEHIVVDRLVDAERTAQRALLLVATDESEVRRFIQALADAGDRAAAVRFYEKFTQRLRAEYEIEPDPVTVECAERIRNKKSVADRGSAAQESTEAGQRAQAMPSALKAERRRRPTRLIGVAAVLAIIGAYAAWSRTIGLRESVTTAETPTIAVLPFQNLGLPDEEYFAEGITEEITARLAGVRDLAVTSRLTAFQYDGIEKTTRQIGEELNVEYLLAGSVRWSRSSDGTSRVRVTPHLIRVSDDTDLWAEVYEEPFTEIFQVQAAIAERVAQALDIALVEPERVRLGTRPTEDLEAYRLYLLGRYHWNKRTQEGSHQAVIHFQQAIDRDPHYARAYAGLADSYSLLGLYGGLSRGEAYSKARAAATRALELDETVAEAHIALAWVKYDYDWDWQAAEAHFRRGLELNPRYATGHHWFAFYWIAVGQFDSAAAAMERAYDLDPTSLIIATQRATPYSSMGEYDRAIELIHKALDLDPEFAPAYFDLGENYVAKEMFEAAVTELQQAVALARNPNNLGYLGLALGLARDTLGARAILGELGERSVSEYVTPMAFAWIYLGLGEHDSTFYWLERSYDDRNHFLTWLNSEGIFDPLRSDPRFADLLRRMNFPR